MNISGIGYSHLRFLLAAVAMSLILISCGSEKKALKPPPEHPIELRVENLSTTVIDEIQAKPCGYSNEYFKTQMHGLKPKQRTMLHIYQECVDLIALDGFGNVMDQLVGLRLNTHITWKIK